MLPSCLCSTLSYPFLDRSATETGTTKKAPKPKKKHSYKTIEQNISNLNVSEADRKCEVRSCAQGGLRLIHALGAEARQDQGCVALVYALESGITSLMFLHFHSAW